MNKRIIAVLAASLLATAACDKQEEPAAEAPAEQVEETGEGDPSAEEGAAKADEQAPAEEAEEEVTTATVGKPAPDFELTDAAGKTHKLSDYRGKTVVLEWTNPGCPVVQRHYEASTMQKSIEAAGAEAVWLAVDSSHTVTPDVSNEWAKEQKVDWPQLQDPGGEVGKRYGAKTTPHMYVVDAEGVLRYDGAIDDDPHGKKKPEERTNFVVQAVTAIAGGEDVETSKTKPYGCSVKYDS